MNQSEMRFLLTQMQSVWKSVEVSETSVLVWHRQFADVPLAMAEKALDAYLRGASGDDFPPKPADLLRMIVRAATALPSEDEAWVMVSAELRRVGSNFGPHFVGGKEYRLRPGIPVLEVALAAESIGWSHMVDGFGDPKQAGFIQHNFRDAYNRAVARTNEVVAVMGVGHLDQWRAEQAAKLRVVHLEAPVTLYALGAPVKPIPGIDVPRESAPLAVEASTGPEISDEQKAINRAKLAELLSGRGTIKSIDPPKPVSALALKRGAE